MPVLYQIDKANGMIRTKCVGDVTLEEVIQHFQTLAQDPDCPDQLDVLLDLTEQTSLPRTDQMREVTSAIGRVRQRVRFRICAIVAATDALFGMLRMFQVFTEDLFHEAEVFRSLHDAEAWLAARRAGEHELPEKSQISRST
jgi:SpoIIAA-like